MVERSDTVVDPWTKVIEFDDASVRDGVVVRAGRLNDEQRTRSVNERPAHWGRRAGKMTRERVESYLEVVAAPVAAADARPAGR